MVQWPSGRQHAPTEFCAVAEVAEAASKQAATKPIQRQAARNSPCLMIVPLVLVECRYPDLSIDRRGTDVRLLPNVGLVKRICSYLLPLIPLIFLLVSRSCRLGPYEVNRERT